MRDYDIPGQIGLEDSVFAYVDHLAKVFSQVRRVLKDDGTLWLNIGDSYTLGGRTCRATDKKNPVRAMNVRPPTPEGLKPKDLIGVPWLLAFALQKEGWYLRADIIWNKPNCQPESVTAPRVTTSTFFSSAKEQFTLFADRVSAESIRANQLRLYLSAMAYLLVCGLRRWGLKATELATAQAAAIRLRLLKIGAQVRVTVRRVWISLPRSYPWPYLFERVHRTLTG